MNIHDLISQYIDGELSSEAEAELHHRLSVSPEDRRLFREQMMLRAAARDPRVLDRSEAALRTALFARLQRDEDFHGALPQRPAYAAQTDAPPVPLSPARAATPRRRRRLVPILLPFVIAIIGGALILQETGDGPTLFRARRSPTGTVSQPEASSPGQRADGASDVVAGTESPAAQPMAGSSELSMPGATGAASGTAGGGSAPALALADASGEVAIDGAGSGARSDRGSEGPQELRRPLTRSAAPVSQNRYVSPTLADMGRGETVPEAERVTERPAAQEAVGTSPEKPAAPISALADAAAPIAPPSAPRGPALGGAAKESVAPRTLTTATMIQPDSLSGDQPMAVQTAPVPAYQPGGESGGFAFVSNVQQNVLLGMRNREVRPELAVRVGGALAGGRHEVFATLGYASYTQSVVSEMVTSQFDTVRGGEPIVSSSRSEVETRRERRPEMWAGVGYRFNAINGPKWVVGAAGWAGAGNRNVRVGAELPVAYRIGTSVRIEIVPSARYVTVRGSAVQSTSSLAPSKNGVTTSSEEVTSSGVELGVGAGVTVVIE